MLHLRPAQPPQATRPHPPVLTARIASSSRRPQNASAGRRAAICSTGDSGSGSTQQTRPTIPRTQRCLTACQLDPDALPASPRTFPSHPLPRPTTPHRPAVALPTTPCRTLPALESHLPSRPTLDKPSPHITRPPLACQRRPSRNPLFPRSAGPPPAQALRVLIWNTTLLCPATFAGSTRRMSWCTLPCRCCPQSSGRQETQVL